MKTGLALLRLLRPHQWVKNTFVFVGLIFGHAWSNPVTWAHSLAAFVAFCALSSAVYVANDWLDREQDRAHPKKRLRPLASGEVSGFAAACLAGAALLIGLLLAAFVGEPLLLIALAYLALNLAYNLGGKHVVLLDVFMIATGFMLRILAGTLGVGVAPSHWLLLCGFSLTLFLGFAKRRAELAALADEDAAAHRRVLLHYSPALLDKMIAVMMSAVLATYSLYTVSPETIALHGTDKLIYTVPCVLYGMFRYLYLLHQRGGGGDPAVELLRDRHLQAAVLAWLAVTVGLLMSAG
ncbi:MAG: hypothetical protein RIR70_365 [Pseudomonadota bacterium]|jgi:4-hydroxybenzoate polyprenyltransferase